MSEDNQAPTTKPIVPAPNASADSGGREMPTQTRPVGVPNEWGKLKEVLVGDSSRCAFPRWSPDWGRYHGFEEMLRGLEGVSLQRAMPERAKGVAEQTEGLVRVLEDRSPAPPPYRCGDRRPPGWPFQPICPRSPNCHRQAHH
jgi:hypothetical protein